MAVTSARRRIPHEDRAKDPSKSRSERHDNVGLLHLNQAAPAAGLQLGHDGVDLLPGIDELDANGQMIGEFDDMRGVDAMPCAEPRYALHRGGARDPLAEQEIEN